MLHPKAPTVAHTRYTVKGAKLPHMKTPNLSSLKAVTKMPKGLKAGKKTATVMNPLRMKANP